MPDLLAHTTSNNSIQKTVSVAKYGQSRNSHKRLKSHKVIRKIQKTAEQLKNQNFEKYIGKYEEGLSLQNKINDVIEDQMFNIQALRERMRSAIEDSSCKTINIINHSDRCDESSFMSETELSRDLDISQLYQKFITGYDHIFEKKVKGWKSDYFKGLTYDDLKIKKYMPERFKRNYLKKLKYKK